MDIQLKRGLLDVSVLAAIKNEDSYGYKIIKDMKPYLELSESTLYIILKRLESGGMRRSGQRSTTDGFESIITSLHPACGALRILRRNGKK